MNNKIKKKNYSIYSMYKTGGAKLGFTLIELLVVIGILAILTSATFATFTGVRSKIMLEDAQASVLSALEQARSRAATGVGTTSHGVYINDEGTKIFSCQGDPCISETSNAITLPFPVSITNPPDLPIIFNRLSATLNMDTIINFKHTISGATSTITVTQEGIIKK